MVDYSKLEALLNARGMNKSELGRKLGISSRTIAKLAKGEKLSRIVTGKICAYLQCEAADIMEPVADFYLLQRLREEKQAGMPGGIYHEFQVRMTYNSNHMEGSRLTEDQTRLIFETSTIDTADGLPVDDILETLHHFRAVDYCIDIAEQPLTEDVVKTLHYMLKHDTKDSMLQWFAVGDYKKRANQIGGRDTVAPGDVQQAMQELLKWYEAIKAVTLEDIVDFHVRFERIHPFQDGNGRVGRLIAWKECLRHGIVPFIIEDHKKGFYYRGLANWGAERGFLLETCLDGQDTVKALMEALGVEG